MCVCVCVCMRQGTGERESAREAERASEYVKEREQLGSWWRLVFKVHAVSEEEPEEFHGWF